MPMDEVLAALNAPQITEMLEITNDDFLLARSDSNLFETMRITYELLLALRDSGVLDTFFRLPAANRKDFLRWLATTADPELRSDRAKTFISALRKSPLR